MAEGNVIIFESNNRLTIKDAGGRGVNWILVDDKKTIAGPFDSAMSLATWVDRNEDKY